MSRSIIAGLLPLILLVPSLAVVLVIAPPLQAQDGFAVQKIAFEGNESIPANSLTLLMETESVGGLSKLLGKKGPEYSREVLAQDLDRIKAFYQREGFLYVAVAPVREETDPQEKTVKLTITITEGEPITVHRVAYTRSESSSVPDIVFQEILKRIAREVALRPETRFRDSSVMLDQLLLARALGNAGYPYAEIEPELAVSAEDLSVAIDWRIDSGPECFFGDVRILGVSKVSEPVITRQVAFHPGDVFRLRSVEQTQQQVYGLGVFQVATATPVLAKDSGNVIPVEAFVKDAKRFTTKFGVGYGTEDHIRVSSETRLLGFLGGARRLQLFMKHSYLEPYHVALTLTQPAFPTPRTTLSFGPFARRQREPAYTINRTGATLGAAHQFSSSLNGSITYALEQVDVSESVLSESTDSTALPGLYNKSQLILGSSFDNSGPLFNPRRGFFNANTIAFSGLGFGGDTRFMKLLIDLRRYSSLSVLVLATRIKLGGIETFGAESFVPVEELFYSGGSSSVRGWARSDLGPKKDSEPIGGQSLMEASIELRYPIIGMLSGVVFSDLGNVWTESFSYDPADLRYSVGAGIRVATPIGPVRLDVARPVADDDDGTQFHISIGQAF